MNKGPLKKEITGLLSLLGIALVCVGIVYAASFYRLTNGSVTYVTNPSNGLCTKVTYNGSPDVHLPANSSPELVAFLNNAPAHVPGLSILQDTGVDITAPNTGVCSAAYCGVGNQWCAPMTVHNRSSQDITFTKTRDQSINGLVSPAGPVTVPAGATQVIKLGVKNQLCSTAISAHLSVDYRYSDACGNTQSQTVDADYNQ